MGIKKKRPMNAQLFEMPAFRDRIGLVRSEIERGKREPAIRALAAQILTQRDANGGWNIRVRDYEGEVKALGDYVRRRVRYTHDIHDVETFQTALRTLDLSVGDCDDMAILLGALLGSVGYPVQLKVVDTTGDGPSHIFVVAGVPPEEPTTWVPLDPTVDKPMGWEIEPVQSARLYPVFGSPSRQPAPLWAWLMVLIGLSKILGLW
jgi:transglutaminase-like putative cysteine protease